MKRFIILLSILILAFVVAACGNNAEAKKFASAGENDNCVSLFVE